jgi:hypothetical protein
MRLFPGVRLGDLSDVTDETARIEELRMSCPEIGLISLPGVRVPLTCEDTLTTELRKGQVKATDACEKVDEAECRVDFLAFDLGLYHSAPPRFEDSRLEGGTDIAS